MVRRIQTKKILKKAPVTAVLCLFLFALLLGQSSCTSTRCVLCEKEKNDIYNVELNDEFSEESGKSVIQTYIEPVILDKKKKGKKVKEFNVVDCAGVKPYEIEDRLELKNFIKNNLIKLDTSDIFRITTTSDADIPPRELPFSEFYANNLCNRLRNGFKIELRGMVAYRLYEEGSQESIFYPSADGGTQYTRQFVGFDQGGTTLTFGPEIALLPRFFRIANRHSFNLGILAGFWPVDGGMYIPLSIHPRLTFNDITDPLWRGCNAWYLFGDYGTAYDASGEIAFMHNNQWNSKFWGAGFGIDFWQSQKMDLSVDAGYRKTELALPQTECGDYPIRKVGQVFIRVGLTF